MYVCMAFCLVFVEFMFCGNFLTCLGLMLFWRVALGMNDAVPDIWQWSELTGFGDLPSPRDFAAASAIGNRKIVM